MTMMTSMKKFALGLSAATLATGGVAYAQMPAGKAGMDADGNGVITRAEAQSSAAAMFARMDVNKDGKIDKTDRDARHTEMRGKMFDKLDTDKNGSISKGEFMADRGPDGARAMHKMDGDGKDKRHGRRGHHGGGMMMMAKMADTNKDGAISQAEFNTAAVKRFDMMDANKDGQVTKEERQASREKMKAEWQSKRADWKAKADAQ